MSRNDGMDHLHAGETRRLSGAVRRNDHLFDEEHRPTQDRRFDVETLRLRDHLPVAELDQTLARCPLHAEGDLLQPLYHPLAAAYRLTPRQDGGGTRTVRLRNEHERILGTDAAEAGAGASEVLHRSRTGRDLLEMLEWG